MLREATLVMPMALRLIELFFPFSLFPLSSLTSQVAPRFGKGEILRVPGSSLPIRFTDKRGAFVHDVILDGSARAPRRFHPD
jgi:hypothetical protein